LLGAVGLVCVVFGRRAAGKSLATHTARYQKWESPIESDGSLEPAESSDIVCRVRARNHGSTMATTIKWVIEDGVLVKKDQPLVELDASGLQEDLKAQQILRDLAKLEWDQAEGDRILVTHQNDADTEAAKTALVIARLDFEKYLNGEYPQAREDVNNRLQQWRDRVGYSERMVRKGFMSRSQAEGGQLALDKVAKELLVLEYTKDRTLADLRSKLAEAHRGPTRVKQQTRARALLAYQTCLIKKRIFLKRDVRVRDLEEDIRRCTIVAPRAGQVVYWVSPQSKYGSGFQQGVVAQGEPVREGQLLMRIPDFKHMMVRIPVQEAVVTHVHGEQRAPTGFSDSLQAALFTSADPMTRLVAQAALEDLRPGFRERDQRLLGTVMPALIRLDAYPGHVFRGHVKDVANVATLLGYRTADVNVYQTLVKIDEAFDGFKPNMTAHVKILAQIGLRPVLTIPVTAIVHISGSSGPCTCYVHTPDGLEQREVVVGAHDEHNAEIQSGLSEGDEVIVEPQSVALE
jgi:HlyD family secretion protein